MFQVNEHTEILATPSTAQDPARNRTLAHLSDLHIGRSASNDQRARRLCDALWAASVDHVVVTGDLTHRGRRNEWQQFREIFAPFLNAGRMTLVPGNHDRLGDDLADDIMPGPRVQVETAPGLFLVRLNSTGPHNRNWLSGHGLLTAADLDAVDRAVEQAPTHRLVVLLLHHHPTHLPEDRPMERLSALMGWKYTSELDAGAEMLARLRRRCDLVLHGHRHKPAARIVHADPRPLRMFNAGSSSELEQGCVFTHRDGYLSDALNWITLDNRAPVRGTHMDADVKSPRCDVPPTRIGRQLAF